MELNIYWENREYAELNLHTVNLEYAEQNCIYTEKKIEFNCEFETRI
jgi:hypothetical protein